MRYGRLAAAVLRASLLAGAVAVAACGGDDSNGGLENPGFEDGMDGWTSLTTPEWEPRFEITTDVVHSGDRSAYLGMRVPTSGGEIRIFGVTQEVTPETFPEELSGWYRVENWQRDTAKQYLQVVVIAWNAANKPFPANVSNHQIRYILAGIDQPPFEIGNAHYVFGGPLEPRQGEWLRFDYDVAADFQRLWGAVPEDYDYIRVLFEVRYDDRQTFERPSADVYYDDLHLGDQTLAPE